MACSYVFCAVCAHVMEYTDLVRIFTRWVAPASQEMNATIMEDTFKGKVSDTFYGQETPVAMHLGFRRASDRHHCRSHDVLVPK